MRTIKHHIAGKHVAGDSERLAPVYNPATGAVQAEVVLAGADEVQQAVMAAREAFEPWANASLTRRSQILFAFRELMHAHAHELTAAVTAEHGKVLSDAAGEVQRGLEVVEYACGIPNLLKGEYSDQVSTGVDSYSFRQPLGVVAGITPFNFPAMVPAWMYPIAIACGNSFILKPSEQAPSASNLVAELWKEAGLPDGVFNVVHGDRVAVEALLDHPDIAAVSFVGSTSVARAVHRRASEHGKRVQALGGAKNHAIVLPDADPDLTCSQLSSAAFGSAGERCMAISVAVMVGNAGDRILGQLQEQTRAITVGPGDEAGSEMGPVITDAARERILDIIGRSEKQGAHVAVDGQELLGEEHHHGFFVGPTILDHVTPEMDAYTEEIFGPVLSVVHVSDIEEAIELVNANPYGNGTAIFTSDGGSARHFTRSIRAGMVGVNVPVPVPMAYHSFGGWQESLFGDHHIHGPEGVQFYTQGKVVTTRWPELDVVERTSFDLPTAS